MSTVASSVVCDSCGAEPEQIVSCDCFQVLCPDCFAAHGCGREHLARWSGGIREPEPTPEKLDPRILLSALPPRDYQSRCIDGIRTELTSSSRTLAVLPTGTGKTIIFGHVARRWKRGRVLVMAHRDELIRQAADKVGRIIGEECDIEMGVSYADTCTFEGKSKVVVTSVQTMCRPGRHERFDPLEFGLLIVDEAHHAVADTYRRVIDYFGRNPALKVLGVTATPDRADEEALGKVFQSVAFEYGILDAIGNGWLVPIQQQFVFVEGLDFSACRTTAGDLNGADLAEVMEQEAMLHKVVAPVLELAGDQQTLIFASSVKHAERMAEIANRNRPGCAEVVHGGTDIILRRELLARYSRREFQFLFNCMIATEGFDEPNIGVVAIARPTKSRSLYAQMIGRGTRPLLGIVDCEPDADSRQAAIKSSSKPSVLVLDFVGNSGRHKLINVADILGGNYEDKTVEKARAAAAKASREGQSVDIAAALARAQQEEEEEKQRRKKVVAKAEYGTQEISPFDSLDIMRRREPGWHKGRKPTEKQLAALRRFKIEEKQISKLTFCGASQLLDGLIRRADEGLCTPKQAALLGKHGYGPNHTFEEASALIDKIAKNGWRRPA